MHLNSEIKPVEIRHFHMCGAIGGGARGFQRGRAQLGNLFARFRCIGSVDVDAAANRDFERATGVKATTLDLFTREQYIAFHGKEPPPGWREATPADLRKAAGGERPHVIFASYPCKGNSGLLSQRLSETEKYRALNALALRGTWLTLEAWKDDPPELWVFENVPRIATRSRDLLDQVDALFHAYGYAVRDTVHDCGELGGLAQTRKRFLKVARHMEKVPAFLYEPPKRPLQSVGSVLGRMRLPGDPRSGPMHAMPRLQWKTWVRLAFVEAGGDWRSLNRLNVGDDGYLTDYLLVPEYREGTGFLGVHKWEDTPGAVCGRSLPTNGAFSVADVRYSAGGEYGQLGVRAWGDTTGTITGQRSPIQGGFSVADPRHTGPEKHSNEFRVVRWDGEPARAITSAHGTGQCVADPRPNLNRGKGDHYLTGGHYGVVRWTETSGAVSASACHDNGHWSVADPRILPAATDRLVARIIAEDGTWHRPFTTLELAALQGLYDPDDEFEYDERIGRMGDSLARHNAFVLDGNSDGAWRERIGNAVPPPAAEAIANEIGRTLLMAWTGETFALNATPIWVRPLAIALSVAGA